MVFEVTLAKMIHQNALGEGEWLTMLCPRGVTTLVPQIPEIKIHKHQCPRALTQKGDDTFNNSLF